MRRKDREICDPQEMLTILLRHDIARVAFCDDGQPYIVPMNFGFSPGGRWSKTAALYFHCALEGRKLDILRRNDRVAFEVDGSYQLLPGDEACDWSTTYESLVGQGRMTVVTDPDERIHGMDTIMSHYGHEGKPSYKPAVFERTAILRLSVESMTGKRKSPPGQLIPPASETV
jgi:nitroimidazol reductase NimA-like FMN-containing flavoprotein (pyridoxamine 5'-phosphate oxidase superfamily)